MGTLFKEIHSPMVVIIVKYLEEVMKLKLDKNKENRWEWEYFII